MSVLPGSGIWGGFSFTAHSSMRPMCTCTLASGAQLMHGEGDKDKGVWRPCGGWLIVEWWMSPQTFEQGALIGGELRKVLQ